MYTSIDKISLFSQSFAHSLITGYQRTWSIWTCISLWFLFFILLTFLFFFLSSFFWSILFLFHLYIVFYFLCSNFTISLSHFWVSPLFLLLLSSPSSLWEWMYKFHFLLHSSHSQFVVQCDIISSFKFIHFNSRESGRWIYWIVCDDYKFPKGTDSVCCVGSSSK